MYMYYKVGLCTGVGVRLGLHGTMHPQCVKLTYTAASGIHSGWIDAHSLLEGGSSRCILPRVEVEGPEVVKGGGVPVYGESPAEDFKTINHVFQP